MRLFKISEYYLGKRISISHYASSQYIRTNRNITRLMYMAEWIYNIDNDEFEKMRNDQPTKEELTLHMLQAQTI